MENRQGMAEFFNALAADWVNLKEEYNTREKLTDMMGIKENSLILDIGCGKGVMFEHLLKTNPKKIIAVDISGEMIKYAKTLVKDDKIECINDDLLTTQLPICDAAVIFNAYPHFTDKQLLNKKLSEHVKKGGLFIIAHSRSKSIINGRHKGNQVSGLSVPLEPAEKEVPKFEEYFELVDMVDNGDIYFIKLKRK